MGHRILVSLLACMLLGLLAACSGAPGEESDTSSEMLTKCTLDDDCYIPPPPHSGKSVLADAAPPPKPGPFPGSTLDESNIGAYGPTVDGSCGSGICWFSNTGIYLSDSQGNLPSCTQVYEFNAGGRLAYLAYCAESARVDTWANAYAAPAPPTDPSSGGPETYVPFDAARSTTQASLGTAASGWTYLTFDEILDVNIIKCKLTGPCFQPPPIVGFGP